MKIRHCYTFANDQERLEAAEWLERDSEYLLRVAPECAEDIRERVKANGERSAQLAAQIRAEIK